MLTYSSTTIASSSTFSPHDLDHRTGFISEIRQWHQQTFQPIQARDCHVRGKERPALSYQESDQSDGITLQSPDQLYQPCQPEGGPALHASACAPASAEETTCLGHGTSMASYDMVQAGRRGYGTNDYLHPRL